MNFIDICSVITYCQKTYDLSHTMSKLKVCVITYYAYLIWTVIFVIFVLALNEVLFIDVELVWIGCARLKYLNKFFVSILTSKRSASVSYLIISINCFFRSEFYPFRRTCMKFERMSMSFVQIMRRIGICHFAIVNLKKSV